MGGVGNDSDHILTAKRYDRGQPIPGRAIIPCRDPVVGIRHALDLVTRRRGSRTTSLEGVQSAP